MPRPKSAQPAYQFHLSGQAVVRLDNVDFYLGKHGTPKSYARYYELLAEYNSNGRKAPKRKDPNHDQQAEAERLADEVIRVKHVTADFRARVLPRYERNYSQHNRYENLLTLLEKRHGDDEADSFGPRKLEALRDHIKANGIGKKTTTKPSRRYVNDLTRMIIKVIRHGVSRELVLPDRIVALEALEPLQRGEAREGKKRKPVTLEDITATLPKCSDTVQAMIRIQLATAMRPSELFTMTPAMIDRSGPVWFYRPDHHKTEDHDIVKAIPILGDALEALAPYLFGDEKALCFVNESGTPWNKDTYRRHVTRAAEAAGVYWTPYQLRHTALQAVRDTAGPEAAQALAGHSRLSTTEIYAKVNELKAIDAAKAAPKLAKSC